MSSCGKNENPQEMNRRKFLKVFGGGAVASSAALYGCAPKNEPGVLCICSLYVFSCEVAFLRSIFWLRCADNRRLLCKRCHSVCAKRR